MDHSQSYIPVKKTDQTFLRRYVDDYCKALN